MISLKSVCLGTITEKYDYFEQKVYDFIRKCTMYTEIENQD